MIRTTFKITRTGLPVMSAKAIENTATRMVEDFLGEDPETPRAIDIDAFLRDYMHLNYEEMLLSHDGYILGNFIFEGSEHIYYWDKENQCAEECFVRSRTVLVDRTRQTEEQVRFTKAHECAHAYFHNVYEERSPGIRLFRESAETMKHRRPKDPKEWQDEDWMEWQANTFASCLLMPEAMVRKLVSPMPRIHTGDPFGDRAERISRVSEVFQVTRDAARVRLDGMGLLEEEVKTGYVCLPMGREEHTSYTGLTYIGLYYDELGNYIPERPLDPPEPGARIITKRRKQRSAVKAR